MFQFLLAQALKTSTWQWSPGSWRAFNSENNKCQEVKFQQERCSTGTAGCQCYQSNSSSHVQALRCRTTSSSTSLHTTGEVLHSNKNQFLLWGFGTVGLTSACWWGNSSGKSRARNDKSYRCMATVLLTWDIQAALVWDSSKRKYAASFVLHPMPLKWFLRTVCMRQHWEFD